MSTSSRTDPSVFQIPVEKMRSGYYADHYFNLTKRLLESDGNLPNVTMQCFQREHSFAGGIDEAIAILKLCSGYNRGTSAENFLAYGQKGVAWVDGWDQLEVKALHEGDEIEPWEPVLQIKGPYHLFAHLETTYLGVMARRSLVMRNAREVCAAANGKPIIFMAARHDHWVVQTGDGMAVHQAGVTGVSTDANGSWWGGRGVGTIPHALIAAYGGDTVEAAKKFADAYGDDMNVTVLVDFHNTSIDTALEVAWALGGKLWGIRLDNSGNLVDESGIYPNGQMGANGSGRHFGLTERPDYGSFKPTGVCPELVQETRNALDNYGFKDVKILVSGGFNAEKIKKFEAARVPVDAYGVGSSLIRGSNDYTADIVETNGRPSAKKGRWMRDDSRLEIVT